jgi:hypothetical protein
MQLYPYRSFKGTANPAHQGLHSYRISRIGTRLVGVAGQVLSRSTIACTSVIFCIRKALIVAAQPGSTVTYEQLSFAIDHFYSLPACSAYHHAENDSRHEF